MSRERLMGRKTGGSCRTGITIAVNTGLTGATTKGCAQQQMQLSGASEGRCFPGVFVCLCWLRVATTEQSELGSSQVSTCVLMKSTKNIAVKRNALVQNATA